METENNTPPPETPKQTKKFQILFLGTIVSILIILFFIGIIPRIEHWRKLEEEAGYVRPITANILTLVPSNKPMELILPSSTEAKRITPIWSRIDGYIKNFLVDIGDNVKQGQLILEIATPELDKQLAQAKADLVSSLAKLEIADITATRWKDLLSANQEAVSTQEVDEKKASLQAILAEVESAKANVERLETIRGFNKIYAPFKGIITQRNIEIGTLVSAGSQNSFQQLFQIADTDIIRVFVNVPQNFYRMIHVGGEADIRIQEFPDKVFKGIIARTSRSLDPLSRTLLTEVHVNNKDGALIIGLYAQVYFNLVSDVPYFIIPTTSLIVREGHPHVAVVNNEGIVTLHLVKIGRDFGKNIEITSGLKEKERIVTNPTERIKDGVKIDIEHMVH